MRAVLCQIPHCGQPFYVTFLFVPQDHFPGGYETLLRDDVAKKEQPAAAAPAMNGSARAANPKF